MHLVRADETFGALLERASWKAGEAPEVRARIGWATAKGRSARLLRLRVAPGAASALRNEEEGTTGFRLTVGPNGRVTDCTVTSSSGSNALDAATCRIMRSRARFTPARNNLGEPTTDSVSARIT